MQKPDQVQASEEEVQEKCIEIIEKKIDSKSFSDEMLDRFMEFLFDNQWIRLEIIPIFHFQSLQSRVAKSPSLQLRWGKLLEIELKQNKQLIDSRIQAAIEESMEWQHHRNQCKVEENKGKIQQIKERYETEKKSKQLKAEIDDFTLFASLSRQYGERKAKRLIKKAKKDELKQSRSKRRRGTVAIGPGLSSKTPSLFNRRFKNRLKQVSVNEVLLDSLVNFSRLEIERITASAFERSKRSEMINDLFEETIQTIMRSDMKQGHKVQAIQKIESFFKNQNGY